MVVLSLSKHSAPNAVRGADGQVFVPFLDLFEMLVKS
jgi:hypothetical protein